MTNLPKYNSNLLLNSALLKKGTAGLVSESLKDAVDPVARIIAGGWAKEENFYPNLAKVCKLEYFGSLPAQASSENCVAQQIPSKLLTEKLIFAFENNGKLIFAVANPFLDQSILAEALTYTGFDKFEIAVSNPNEIQQALATVYYYDLSISSQDRIDTFFPTQSARSYPTLIVPKIFPIFSFAILGILILVYPVPALLALFIILNLVYFLINPYKIYVFSRSFSPLNSIFIKNKQITELNYKELPVYTVLIPLKSEAQMVEQIIENVFSLDYPTDKLDIKFITEVNDKETIAALEKEGIGVSSADASIRSSSAQLIKVPVGIISTKPRSCDYALGFSRGSLITIYDAEDRPDRDQLKKIVLGFRQSRLTTVCIQSRLNYYNSRQNILSRMFSLEYGFWFDYYLPGLQEVDSPIPLGGTSNHFIANTLKKIGVWDPFNVTEDADLGLRIFRHGLKTSVINSNTLEEANSSIGGWLKQRTRWQKGFLITFLVHISRSGDLLRDLGLEKFILSCLSFGGNFFLPFFNPFLWFIFIISYLPVLTQFRIPPVIEIVRWIALFNLVVGNLTYIVIHLISSLKNKRPDLAVFTLLLPFYWMLISLATYRAAWQFIFKPFYWEKTRHGLRG